MSITITWVRVSARSQIQNSSILQQNIAVSNAAKSVFSCYNPIAYTMQESSAKNRTQFVKMLNECIAKKANLVVFSVDRFSREGKEKASEHLTKLLNAGCSIHFVSENVTLCSLKNIALISSELDKARKEIENLSRIRQNQAKKHNLAKNLDKEKGTKISAAKRKSNQSAKVQTLGYLMLSNPNATNKELVTLLANEGIKATVQTLIQWKKQLCELPKSKQPTKQKRKYVRKLVGSQAVQSKTLVGYEPKNASEHDKELFYGVLRDNTMTNKSKAIMLNELGFKPSKAKEFNEQLVKNIKFSLQIGKHNSNFAVNY